MGYKFHILRVIKFFFPAIYDIIKQILRVCIFPSFLGLMCNVRKVMLGRNGGL
jgi:hypothetical protein